MLARLQQLITIGLASAAVTWAAYFANAGAWGWAAGGALLIVLGYSLFLAIEFALMRWINSADAVVQPHLRQLVAAWFGEVLAAPRVFGWRQPFRSRAVPDYLPTESHRRGVVLVHGFFCNRGLWNPFMQRLRALGVPFVAVNLEPVFGSIDDYVEILDAAIQRIIAATGMPPAIVAHSMGGLATRAWLHTHSADAQVHRVLTIGTPHRGTLLGHLGQIKSARQMRLNSAWLQALRAKEPAKRFEKFTCFYGHCDNIVFPATTATLPGADNRHVPGCAHVQMVHHEDVFNETLRWVGSPSTPNEDSTTRGEALAR